MGIGPSMHKSFKTQCKLGGHGILSDQPAVWLRSPYPLGLSCLDCARSAGVEVTPSEPARKVPDFTNWAHGKVGTYNKGCRCVECKAANTARSVEYKRARRERQAAA